MKLAYRGANFHGWQIQPNASSVQETIERALSMIFRMPVAIVGAGRTDTGVNARVMYAHFDVADMIDDKPMFLRRINSLVGRDIAISDIIPVDDGAHARFDAVSRTYRYFVHGSKSPFIYDLSWQAPSVLDYEMMNRAASVLLGVDDFTSFAKLHSDARTNICKVTRAGWVRMDDTDRYYFEITADRFLRNMVRAVVGTLVDVGRHKLSIEQFSGIISAHDRCAAGTSMPPQALFLWDVRYPYL